ncbi:type II/IV secretion system ATPase subunit [Candidatus Micrarchaeota archaeon]|nr:type II/IV secretion system ATPase subunit [Candidatus Micrarchaeota archaeon]MBU2476899.1 type II/IV secretion system ATPase subunit [Candidatus Micrarchaeota archaeon]
MKEKVLETYKVKSIQTEIEVNILEREKEFVRIYFLNFPEFGEGTEAVLKNLKRSIITDSTIQAEKMMDPNFVDSLKKKFQEKAEKILERELPKLNEGSKGLLIGLLLEEMLGLGKLEFLLNDGNIEEIVVNSATEPVWVYHKGYGWLKTNVYISPESEIQNYASIIARRIGKQITILNPLLDAHLITGDRANATLFPISGKGNTITIRRFRREPYTITDFVENNTANTEIMALIWLAMEYELNIVFSGGTGSGKTTSLNVCMPFIQPNQRIVSIEDTREISLPAYLHWVPLTTREPNTEGKGEVTMLNLLVNSLRMRPDRLIVGEIRRQKEAEVLFEAMHTGHSAYTTFHANTAEETIRRLINPPIEVPKTMLDSVHLNVVMFRNRRLNVRRMLQIAEYVTERRGNTEEVKANVLYRWKGATDTIEKHSESIRLFDELGLHTGFSKQEMNSELKDKKTILDWLVKNKIHAIKHVGRIMANYYMDKEEIIEFAEKNKIPDFLEEETHGKNK